MSDTDWNRNLGYGFGMHKPTDEYYHGIGPAGETLPCVIAVGANCGPKPMHRCRYTPG